MSETLVEFAGNAIHIILSRYTGKREEREREENGVCFGIKKEEQ